MGYEQYLRSAYQTEETEATKGQALRDKERQNKLILALLGVKGADLTMQLRNKSIRDRMTGKDVYYNERGMPMKLSRGVEKPTEGMLDTFRRSVWGKESDYVPMDYSGIEGLSMTKPAQIGGEYIVPGTTPQYNVPDDLPIYSGGGVNDPYGVMSAFEEAWGSGPEATQTGGEVGGLLGGAGNILGIVQGLRGLDTTGYRSASEANKQKWSSGIDAALAASMFTPLAPVTGPMALGKSLLSWLT